MKRSFLIGLLVLCAACAQAQIVTPYLDPGWRAGSPAALGWKGGSGLFLVVGSGKGEVENSLLSGGELSPAGEAKSGAAAKGHDDFDKGIGFPLPTLVLKNETLGMELAVGLGDGTFSDIEVDTSGSLDNVPIFGTVSADLTLTTNIADKNSHLYLSYLAGESLSIGLGYRQRIVKTRSIVNAIADLSIPSLRNALDYNETQDLIYTGLSLVASYKLAEIFYVAAGVENMTRTGSFERITNADLLNLFPAAAKSDYVELAWSNTLMGIGMLIGEPDETQFRLEYSKKSAPESKMEAVNDKHASYYRKQDITYSNLEAKLGSILLSYRNELTVNSRMPELLNNEEERIDDTLYGVGWIDPEGLSITAYSIARKQTRDANLMDSSLAPAGWTLNLTYPF